ncbi:transcription factor [Geomonas limicola]|uniref:Transcription factor n=1 Tax=Geomonas limicola TaxID=2740186 RepID=A0A6V8NEH4_9BACT|nr:IPT/TIG domain-containing protein [Geomonas limicola]GFO70177.1 transcription factor [Geomonas limicola]
MNRFSISILMICLFFAATCFAQGPPGAAPPRKGGATSEAKLPPLTVLSIIPAQGEPGTAVTLSGTGFTTGTAAWLGTQELPTTVLGPKVLSVVLPELPAGVYALYLKREDNATSRAYNFNLQPVKPVASNLLPETVTICASGREREVVLSGTNFQPNSKILLDGAAVGTRVISGNALSFMAPQLAPGLHQVQVLNPPEALSGTLALFLDSRPEILGVAVGSDFVSYYELVITGRNFLQNSVLVADGTRVGTRGPAVGDRDNLVYRGCNQIVYQRHPYDPSPKDIRLQVVNQNGEESNLYTISAP